MGSTLEKQKIIDMFQAIDNKLNNQQTICIVGSSVLIMLGMPSRYTKDIDVWDIYNKENYDEFKNAVIQSGFLYNPTDYEELDDPYVQLINHQFVHMPQKDFWHDETQILWEGAYLTVLAPPIEVIATSKLAAARDRDFDDVDFLFNIESGLEQKIKNIASYFEAEDEENALNNLVVIEVIRDHAVAS